MRAAALLAALLLAAFPAGADTLKLDRTEPEHQRALNLPPDPPQPLAPRTRHIRPSVVYRLPMDVPEVATADRTLSRLCRGGAFIQARNGFYWARTPQRSYGVAFSGGANLDDPQNRAQPGKVYFFDAADTPRCTVYVADQAKLMAHYVGP